MYEQLIATFDNLCVSNLHFVCWKIAVTLEKMTIFGIIGENFSLICNLLCRMTNLANFRCFSTIIVGGFAEK